MFLVKEGKSSLQRLIKPSKSAQTDIWMYVFLVTGIIVFLYAAMTLGASEFVPYLLNRMPEMNVLAFTDNAWLKFAIIYLTLNFLEYWAHRFGHEWKWAWAGHKFHHAATEMTMLSAYRNSPIGGILPMLMVSIPAAILGKSGLPPLAGIGTLIIVHNLLNHSNVTWTYGWVGKYIIASPRYHRIHHSTHPDHWDTNYGDQIILWDRLFGTYYKGDVEPLEVGYDGNTSNKHGLAHDLLEGGVDMCTQIRKAIVRK
jgi:sterol desaturase/sphingolipid hydroxylase (fatty acid hydroxylase superfamily)